MTIGALFLFSTFTALALGQATMTQTTLASPVKPVDRHITLTSKRGVTSPGKTNAPTTVLFIDREEFRVTSAPVAARVGWRVRVQRGAEGTPITSHTVASTVWVGPPAYFFSDDPIGACTSNQIAVLPRISVHTGNVWNCTKGSWRPSAPASLFANPMTLRDQTIVQGPDGAIAVSSVVNSDAYSSIQAAYAAGPSTGVTIFVPTSRTDTSAITLIAGKPLDLSCAKGVTVTWNTPGYWINVGATTVVHNVNIHDCSISTGSVATGAIKVGDVNTDVSNTLYRVGWSVSNLVIVGPGDTVATSLGISLTQLVGLTINNLSLEDYYEPALFDRCSAYSGNHVRFHNYSVGPKFTSKGGTGTAATYAADTIFQNVEFLGPTQNGIDAAVLIDHSGVEFVQALYEPTASATAGMHITANGGNFRDYGGRFSFGVNPKYTMLWDDQFSDVAFYGTVSSTNQPICIGSPGVCAGSTLSTGIGAACFGCSSPLYQLFMGLTPYASAFGAGSAGLGGLSTISGPLVIDVPSTNSFVLKARSNKTASSPGDQLIIDLPMKSIDGTGTAATRIYALVDSTLGGQIKAGICIHTGNQSSSSCNLYVDGNGNTLPTRNVIVPNAQAIYWATRTALTSPNDGILDVTNNAGTAALDLGVSPPVSAATTCAKITISADASYVYVCGPGGSRRVAVTAW